VISKSPGTDEASPEEDEAPKARERGKAGVPSIRKIARTATRPNLNNRLTFIIPSPFRRMSYVLSLLGESPAFLLFGRNMETPDFDEEF
jgi:hypothetical protein